MNQKQIKRLRRTIPAAITGDARKTLLRTVKRSFNVTPRNHRNAVVKAREQAVRDLNATLASKE